MPKPIDVGATRFEDQQFWNCKPKFEFQCTQRWDGLTPTGDAKIRHCEVCEKEVHLCRSPEEFVRLGEKKHCVAIPENRTIGFAKEWTQPMLGRPDPDQCDEGNMALLYWWALSKKRKRFFRPALDVAHRSIELWKRPVYRLPHRKVSAELRRALWPRYAPDEVVVEFDPQYEVSHHWDASDPHSIPPFWTGLVMSSQYGFNTFGGISRWLVAELGYEYREILDIINWATNDCEEPTLIRVASKNSQGTVGGIVFAPGENALCYKKFVRSHHSKPYRNFFYNVTFEAYSVLGDLIPEPEDSVSIGSFAAIGVSELSGGTNGHPDIVKAQVEAFYHYCEHRPDVAIDRLRLFGCISGKAFESIAELLPTLKGTTHRRIQVEKGRTGQFDTFVLRGFAPAAV